MRKAIAKGLILAGAVLLVAALALLLYNQWRTAQAAKGSRALLSQMQSQLLANIENPIKTEPDKMPVVTLDGDTYIGVLSIPSLKLELPVMEQWSYPKLKTAPCRFYGTAAENNLVIMAHNFRTHFGKINRLSAGDSVTFTDTNGHTIQYQVVEKDIVNPYAVNETVASDFDLTLFTCTYGGRTRVTVYCNRI